MLHPYQHKTAEFIVDHPSVFCIQGLGLGKTASTITAIRSLLDQFMVNRVLVIAPLRVANHTWPEELAKWGFDLTWFVATGAAAIRRKAIESIADIVIINRENVQWLVSEYGKRWPFDMVVVDESSSFKNHSSNRFKALKKVRPYINRIVLLTGTPCPNSLLELWPQLYLLDSGKRLGSTFSAFRSRFFDSDYMGFHYTPKDGAEKRIYDDISDLCLTMSVSDYLQLPERVECVVPAVIEPFAKYTEMEAHMTADIDRSTIDAATAAVLCGKLQQLAQGAVYDEHRNVCKLHDAKLDALEDLLEAVPDENVIVAYTYRHDAIRIRDPSDRDIDQTDRRCSAPI